jgi:hypothetical protein
MLICEIDSYIFPDFGFSADGTKIAFTSDPDYLNQGIEAMQDEVWLFDTRAMTLTRVTTATYGDADSHSSDLDWEKSPAVSILDALVPISILLTIRLGGTIM